MGEATRTLTPPLEAQAHAAVRYQRQQRCNARRLVDYWLTSSRHAAVRARHCDRCAVGEPPHWDQPLAAYRHVGVQRHPLAWTCGLQHAAEVVLWNIQSDVLDADTLAIAHLPDAPDPWAEAQGT